MPTGAMTDARAEGRGPALAASVTVVVVTFNSEDVIGDSLAKIPPGCEIHVVDNASTDGTRRIVEACGSVVRLSTMPRNVGFARACNHALRAVETPHALLLNPDAALDAAGLERLLSTMLTTPDLAILAPLFSDRAAQGGGAPTEAVLRDVPQVVGACMLIDVRKLAGIGFFDETFFLYYEDSDLCMRARAAGFRVCVARDVVAFHADGHSSSLMRKGDPLRQRLIAQSQSYFIEKHDPRGRRRILKKASAYLFTTIGCFIVGRWGRARERFARLRGTLGYLVRGPAVLHLNRLTRQKRPAPSRGR